MFFINKISFLIEKMIRNMFCFVIIVREIIILWISILNYMDIYLEIIILVDFKDFVDKDLLLLFKEIIWRIFKIMKVICMIILVV